MTDREWYVDKIRKLLAKAERTDSQEEAEAFFTKAAELMTQWRVEDAELADAGDAIETRSVPLGTYDPTGDVMTMTRILRPLGIRVAFTPYHGAGTKPLAWWYGWRSDMEKAEMLWASISIQMLGAMRRRQPAGMDRNRLRVWKRSFKIGYGETIGLRLTEGRTVSTDTTPGTGLVLLSRERQVEDFINSKVSASRRSKVAVSDAAMNTGRQAATTADIGSTRVGTTRKALQS